MRGNPRVKVIYGIGNGLSRFCFGCKILGGGPFKCMSLKIDLRRQTS